MRIARNGSYSEDNALYIVFSRQKVIAGANLESPSRTQLDSNIRKLSLPVGQYSHRSGMNVFLQVVQYSQGLEGKNVQYRVLGFNETLSEDGMKKSIVNWFFNLIPTKIITHRLFL